MKSENVLKLRIVREKTSNVFCPRCGVIVPPETVCIPSPTRPEVHYHPKCLLAMAQQLGRPVQWADC